MTLVNWVLVVLAHRKGLIFFKLYALNQLLELAPGASKTDILAASAGHILEQVELMGHYARQSSI